ncbi:malonate decarboxylase holo-ACP synthase [Schleiferilactobacillus perolens]|jgi:phosphoribosyl-dephospho-CoA transferase|uniref:malonate decarboxylase holo-ACP synthase n=1 Tax=Schleiferilactobacillus perolens TaxID=100468 RepID=UPI002354A4AE|nr:malonate decarboxylase holo-ACP synthase [Schleiferilactobacillus perolens]MCI2170098.1 malonate decarboxylase holo-ACP synthase [Schleiferilactobacillus perolens]
MARLIAPHTLIKVGDLADLKPVDPSRPMPDWALTMLQQAPYVIVRRGPQDGVIPVGIRGYQKRQRFPALLPVERVTPDQLVTPQQVIANQHLRQLAPDRLALPAFQALQRATAVLRDYHWGVGGSLQFELVTGLPMANENSDLDIIMDLPPQDLSVTQARALLQALNQTAAHADVQVVAGQDGFSLEEYANHTSHTVMVKSAAGPLLTVDPWAYLRSHGRDDGTIAATGETD